MRIAAILSILLLLGGCAVQPLPVQPAVPEKMVDGVVFPLANGFLKLQPYSDDVIRVAFAPDRKFFARKSISAVGAPDPKMQWTFSGDSLSTGKITARVDLVSGAVSFFDATGKPILREKSDGRSVDAAAVQGENIFHVRQQWEPAEGESLYGLGQQQLGLLNIKGYDIDLWQHNGTVIVPVLVSSKGYGIFWDNTSYTRFGDLRPFEPIPGGFTGSYYAGANFDRLVATRHDAKIDIETMADDPTNGVIHPDLPRGDVSVRWEGDVQPDVTGDYQFQTFSNCGIKLWIDNQLLINHWRQGWLPWNDLARQHLEAGRTYHIRLDWSKDQGMPNVRLLWKTPSQSTATSLWSEVGDGVDYYFLNGPSIDNVVAGYRRVTGKAPIMPIWAMGLWPSRQRYETAQASLDVVNGFRLRSIPFDNIVQDWFYWKAIAWGSHQFDPARFPDPQGWVDAIHALHSHLMISVWGKFYPGTENFQAMDVHKYLFESDLTQGLHDWIGYRYTFYDAFNAGARKLFWSQLNRELFAKHVDAWLLDATEPDMLPVPTLDGQRTNMNPTAMGSGSRMLNAYSLMQSEAIYDGQRAAAPDQRVVILTRSAFAGQQRYSSATWSGDITSTWTAMRKQIPAGLGFCLSGIPWWTMDTGGFAVPPRFSRRDVSDADFEEWCELNARWFEFGTFVPLLRVHGEFPYREMWQFGGDKSPTYQAELKFDRLRYRLLPYIYSLAADVSQHDSTIMRALVMDFPADEKAHDISDQYMFGPAFLVSPITEYKSRSRPVYLPQSAGWYDFWTGALSEGGQTVTAPAPYDSIPLHVKAGSIIPMGPEIQYTTEKPADPITLYIYSGADGSFSLYEDDGDSYDYEQGKFTRISLNWNDAAKTLTIGKREGSFPKMLGDRTFNIVLISKDHPVGFSFTPQPVQTIQYTGGVTSVQLH